MRTMPTVLLGTLLAGGLVASAQRTDEVAERARSLERKLALIVQQSHVKRDAPHVTTITQGEVNAYLRLHGAALLPAGVVEPQIAILGQGRLAGSAWVDLDAVRQSRPRAWFDPAAYLSGRVPVAATGILRTANGIGRLEIESAQVAGVAVPKGVLQDVVAYYTRSADGGHGLDLDAPFALPAGIREIRVGQGRAVVVQ